MIERKRVRCVLGVSAALLATACNGSNVDRSDTGQAEQGLAHSPRHDDNGDPREPARDYTLFEADPVRPIAVLAQSSLIAVTNTFDDRLELLRADERGAKACGSVKVGMRPVAVAAVGDSKREAELWVVNHLSDSVSVVRVDPQSCEGSVIRTLHTGDEPRDIVVAQGRGGKRRVFVTTAHRGQHHPVESARLGKDLVTPPDAKAAPGLADVFVFDPRGGDQPLEVVNLFTDVPRALAVGDGVVYAAGFRTGNRTTVVHAERVAERGLASLSPLLAKDEHGAFVERDGELVLSDAAHGQARIEGGLAAVSGRGRCMPDPRLEQRDVFLQQVCVKTDADHRVLGVYTQQEGVVQADCQCTSGDGSLQPTTSAIVKFFDQPSACGEAFTTFPDGSRGCWLDAEPGGVDTPAINRAEQAPPMAWNDDVRFSLPDQDVFAIDVDSLRVKQAYSGVGTVLYGMAVQPRTGKLFVANTEANNLTRFEGKGLSSSTSVIGHLHESRITVIDPLKNAVTPVHLNTHIDYSECCEVNLEENEQSFAFPTAGAFSSDGRTFFFTALGSDKIGVVDAGRLGAGFDNAAARRERALFDIELGYGLDDAAGPVGLTYDEQRRRLYVKTHMSNELVVVDPSSRKVLSRVALYNPEPPSIRDGRAVLYDARTTSSHGDSACGSCHVFGDLDGLSWDLGDPDNETVQNPGPFVVPTELAVLPFIARDPAGENPLLRPLTPDFRSNKGPMTTQTLRGMANHGALHWRGDRTRRAQTAPGAQPNFGSLDENSSFNEFDVAIEGLNGNHELLSPAEFQRFTDFALQLTLPPNPIRALDDSLSAEQNAARALYFGCASMTDEQYSRRECTDLAGSVVAIDRATEDCACASNPLLGAMQRLPEVQGLAELLRALWSHEALRAGFDATASDPTGLSAAGAERQAALMAGFVAARAELMSSDLSLDGRGFFSEAAASALSRTAGALVGLVELSASEGTATGEAMLSLLAGSIPAEVLPEHSPLRSAAGLRASLEGAFGASNLTLRVLVDEASRGTADWRDLLQGCDVQRTYTCELRVTDSFQTCHGCHTLDPQGNAEHGVYRPGFFGTSGKYSFEAESQVFKVPHLRNMYQKTGMFGTAQVAAFLPESLLGADRGGFFASETRFTGPQVRGTGFLHDGAVDTLHRFHGGSVFVTRPVDALGVGDPGNARGFEPVLPAEATRAACVDRFRGVPDALLASLPAEQAEGLALCQQGSPVPDVCFLEPSHHLCQGALTVIGEAIGDADFATTFESQIRLGCFQLGSMLEGGTAEGACYPEGLRERAAMESFMMAFDSNLKPSVGQQVTVAGKRYDDRKLVTLLAAAERGHCDLALRRNDEGYLVTEPNPSSPDRSRILDAKGRRTKLGELSAHDSPVTFTCYPPHPERAEARRAAFDDGRHDDGEHDCDEHGGRGHHHPPRPAHPGKHHGNKGHGDQHHPSKGHDDKHHSDRGHDKGHSDKHRNDKGHDHKGHDKGRNDKGRQDKGHNDHRWH